MAHAKLSPSSSGRWLTCLASPIMEEGKPNPSNEYAAEGTAAHFLGETCLLEDLDAEHYLGSTILVGTTGDTYFDGFGAPSDFEIEYSFEVNDDMAMYVQEYVQLVRDLRDSTKGEMLVEQKLPLEEITGETGATGTADTVILTDDTIYVIDLKYGQGLRVEPVGNTQLQMYALAAMIEYEFLGDFKWVEVIISQPRKEHTASWRISRKELEAFGTDVQYACTAISTIDVNTDLTPYFAPSVDACRYCLASTECKALANDVRQTISDDFDMLDEKKLYTVSEARYDTHQLGELFLKVPLIEQWIKNVNAQVYSELMDGIEIKGLKLVQGNQGKRKWSDETEAEKVMKSVRLKMDHRFEKKLASPTTLEKLVKSGELSQAQWERLNELVSRSEGKPTVALADDKREAISLIDDFINLDEVANNVKQEA